MTEEQALEILQELEAYNVDYNNILNMKLYNVINEHSNQPVTKIEELFLDNSGHMIPMEEAWSYILDTYEVDHHVNMSQAKETVKRAIIASYFITAALDRLVSKAKTTNKIFKDKTGTDAFKFDFVIFWSFVNNVFHDSPCFYLHLNDISNAKREIDLGVSIKFSTEHGWMNGPLEVKAVDYYSQHVYKADFIKCLEDFNFSNIQKAINLVF